VSGTNRRTAYGTHHSAWISAPRRLSSARVTRHPLSLRPTLEAYTARLRPIFGDRLHELRLFGSYARSEANEDSDVDVLVLVEGLSDREIGVVAREAACVLIETGLPLSPLPMATEELEKLRRGERLLARDLDSEG
jgi:predicted nucleotidyltransferase